jgi:dTDP-glucose pyrophosphorylase
VKEGPILAVLAAGIGSRYRGLKQMDKFGAHGEVLLDYAVFDALRSGFTKVVFIIKRGIEKDFTGRVLSRMKKVNCDIAFQELDSLIPKDLYAKFREAGRVKPWGTAHALICAADKIDAPFCVINADDFYSREAFAVLGAFLNKRPVTDGALVPYALEKTLSRRGTVSRGVCTVRDGCLVSVEELLRIEQRGGKIFNTESDGSLRELAADTPVSMNCWGFPESALPAFKTFFADFLSAAAGDIAGNLKAECYIPKAVDWFIQRGVFKVRALETKADWFGVTYQEDRDSAIARIKELTASGVYPENLWE